MKIGSPEEFQGDERRIIIISTVRSAETHLIQDFHNKLGFLRNPKVCLYLLLSIRIGGLQGRMG